MEKTSINYFPVEEGKSGIKIKPENRGKFNATKKRTGKTAEELAHSKNPLTRKRAIFELNARKWRHKEGGEIESYQNGGLTTSLGITNPSLVNKINAKKAELDPQLRTSLDTYLRELLDKNSNPSNPMLPEFVKFTAASKLENGGQINYFQKGGKSAKYTVAKGDTLGGIAKKHGLTTQELLKLNSGITNPDKIREGLVLTVAKPTSSKTNKPSTKPTTQPSTKPVSNPTPQTQYMYKGKAYDPEKYATFEREYNAWAAKHPTVKLNGVTVNTSDLKDYIYDLASHESSFDNKALYKAKSQNRGYFQIKGTSGKHPFDDLIVYMNQTLPRLTKDDVELARKRGLSDAAILAKVHNQRDNFVNWLWGGADTEDAVGTKVSQYGNDWQTNLNILDKVVTLKALRPGDYVILKKNESYQTYSPTIRYPEVIINNTPALLQLEYERRYPQRPDSANPWVNDTIWIPRMKKEGGRLKLIKK